MNIPDEIKVKAKTYKIEYDGELMRDQHRFGAHYGNKLKIILDPTQPKDRLDQSFLHELLHAIIDSSSLRVSLQKDLQEQVITGLANDLLLVIRENNLDLR